MKTTLAPLLFTLAVTLAWTTFAAPRDASSDSGSCATDRAASARTALRVGEPVPSFRATLADGQSLRSSELTDRFVLLDFWGTWCSYCVAEFPRLRALSERYSDQLHVVGVSLDKERATLERMIAERGITWPQIWDRGGEGRLEELFAISDVPSVFLMAPGGKLLTGEITLAEAEKRLPALLRESRAR